MKRNCTNVKSKIAGVKTWSPTEAICLSIFLVVGICGPAPPNIFMIIILDRRRIHEFLFHESPYDPDTSPILNHTHQHPVEVDVWIEIHTINEGFYLNFLIQNSENFI